MTAAAAAVSGTVTAGGRFITSCGWAVRDGSSPIVKTPLLAGDVAAGRMNTELLKPLEDGSSTVPSFSRPVLISRRSPPAAARSVPPGVTRTSPLPAAASAMVPKIRLVPVTRSVPVSGAGPVSPRVIVPPNSARPDSVTEPPLSTSTAEPLVGCGAPSPSAVSVSEVPSTTNLVPSGPPILPADAGVPEIVIVAGADVEATSVGPGTWLPLQLDAVCQLPVGPPCHWHTAAEAGAGAPSTIGATTRLRVRGRGVRKGMERTIPAPSPVVTVDKPC